MFWGWPFIDLKTKLLDPNSKAKRNRQIKLCTGNGNNTEKVLKEGCILVAVCAMNNVKEGNGIEKWVCMPLLMLFAKQ